MKTLFVLVVLLLTGCTQMVKVNNYPEKRYCTSCGKQLDVYRYLRRYSGNDGRPVYTFIVKCSNRDLLNIGLHTSEAISQSKDTTFTESK